MMFWKMRCIKCIFDSPDFKLTMGLARYNLIIRKAA